MEFSRNRHKIALFGRLRALYACRPRSDERGAPQRTSGRGFGRFLVIISLCSQQCSSYSHRPIHYTRSSKTQVKSNRPQTLTDWEFERGNVDARGRASKRRISSSPFCTPRCISTRSPHLIHSNPCDGEAREGARALRRRSGAGRVSGARRVRIVRANTELAILAPYLRVRASARACALTSCPRLVRMM